MRRTRDADIHIKRHDRSGRAKVSKIFLYVSVTSSNIEYVVSAYDEENNKENDPTITDFKYSLSNMQYVQFTYRHFREFKHLMSLFYSYSFHCTRTRVYNQGMQGRYQHLVVLLELP